MDFKIINMGMLATFFAFSALGATEPIRVLSSPDKKITATLSLNDRGHLQYLLQKDGDVIIDNSKLGIVVDGVDMGGDSFFSGSPEKFQVNTSYPWVGKKSVIVNHYNGMRIPLQSGKKKINWLIEMRVFNDGFAFRYIIPGSGKRRVNSETTTFNLIKGSEIWYRLNKPQYERLSKKSSVEAIEPDYNMQVPVTVELPGSKGFAAITEAGGFIYSGLSLKANGTTELSSYFAGDRKGFSVEGEIVTPWRIVMVGATPNDLVNCDIVYNVCPAPDKKLFPNGKLTKWIKPGRSLWNWWAYGKEGIAWNKQKKMVDYAAKLKCQYYLIDWGWEEPRYGWFNEGEKEKKWVHLKELVDYAGEKGVSILVWRHWNSLRSKKRKDAFFSKLSACGVKGAKIDFLASEGVDRRKFVIDTLKNAASHKIMVNFHGAPKPAGECKTWPNEVSREGIFGLEHNRLGGAKLSTQHYCLMPFTRGLAGHGDFTPTTFQKDKLFGTTFSLQLAMAIVEDSSILCWADKPDIYLESPALTFIQTIPPVWDETRYLPATEIGKFVLVARRSGKDWFVAAMNGDDKSPKDCELDLSFLGEGNFSATYCRDNLKRADDLVVEKDTVDKNKKILLKMLPGGGFVGRFIHAN